MSYQNIEQQTSIRSYIKGSRQLSNIFWALAVSAGGLGFFADSDQARSGLPSHCLERELQSVLYQPSATSGISFGCDPCAPPGAPSAKD